MLERKRREAERRQERLKRAEADRLVLFKNKKDDDDDDDDDESEQVRLRLTRRHAGRLAAYSIVVVSSTRLPRGSSRSSTTECMTGWGVLSRFRETTTSRHRPRNCRSRLRQPRSRWAAASRCNQIVAPNQGRTLLLGGLRELLRQLLPQSRQLRGVELRTVGVVDPPRSRRCWVRRRWRC